MQDPSAFAAVLQQHPLNPLQFPEQEQLRCPRCDSTNTKFCYYNNYNLSQPRHFCKSCRRYWTKGGTLRNVPVGGGSRKSSAKRSSSSSAAASSASKRYSSSSPSPASNPPPSSAGPSGRDLIPKPEALSPMGFPVGRFTSLLASNGQFGSLLEGIAPGLGSGFSPGIGLGPGSGSSEGVLGESGGCWRSGGSDNGWPDLAIFTPSSRLQ